MNNRLISQPQSIALRNHANTSRLQQQLVHEFGSNKVDIYVLTASELTRLWLSTNSAPSARSMDFLSKTYSELVGASPDAVINYTSAVADSVVLAKLGEEMRRSGNILGSYKVVQRNGRSLIIFSGYAGLRRTLTAPVYGVGHPKVIQMGIGRSAAQATLKSGVIITLIVSPIVRTIEWLFIDEKATLELVLARISSDVIKGVVAAGAGYASSLFLAAISGVSVIAVAPLAGGIGIALLVGFGLNSLDSRLGLTERLAASLAKAQDNWLGATREVRRDFNHFFFTTEGALELINRFTGGHQW